MTLYLQNAASDNRRACGIHCIPGRQCLPSCRYGKIKLSIRLFLAPFAKLSSFLRGPCIKLLSAMLFLFLMIQSTFAGYAGSVTQKGCYPNLGPNNDMYADIWHTGGTCISMMTWNAACDSMFLNWNSTCDDQILRVGKGGHGSSPGYLNVKLDDIRDNCIASVTANMQSLNYMEHWGIYGWTGPTYRQGSVNFHQEFYVVFQGAIADAPENLGTATIDGVQFEFSRWMSVPWSPSQDMYLAICRSGQFGTQKSVPWTASASIDLKKIFAYWRSKGMLNEYVQEITWGVEAKNGSTGRLQMSNMVIPDIIKTSGTAQPAPFGSRPSMTNQALPTVTDAAGGIRINLPNGDMRGLVALLASSGAEVRSIRTSSSGSIFVPTSGLAKGVYVLRFQEGERTSFQRLVLK